MLSFNYEQPQVNKAAGLEDFYCVVVVVVYNLLCCVVVFSDCMKGDETENKKIGCTVNLLVRVTSS